jgi:hypothetical protein
VGPAGRKLGKARRARRRHVTTMTSESHTVASVSLPDTKLAREATELVRDTTDDLIYHHSRRVCFFGSL